MTMRDLLVQRAKGPVAVSHPDRRVDDVREMMIEEGLQFIPIIEHNKLLGIATYSDVVNYCRTRAAAEKPAPSPSLAATLAATSSGQISGDLMGKTGK